MDFQSFTGEMRLFLDFVATLNILSILKCQIPIMVEIRVFAGIGSH